MLLWLLHDEPDHGDGQADGPRGGRWLGRCRGAWVVARFCIRAVALVTWPGIGARIIGGIVAGFGAGGLGVVEQSADRPSPDSRCRVTTPSLVSPVASVVRVTRKSGSRRPSAARVGLWWRSGWVRAAANTARTHPRGGLSGQPTAAAARAAAKPALGVPTPVSGSQPGAEISACWWAPRSTRNEPCAEAPCTGANGVGAHPACRR